MTGNGTSQIMNIPPRTRETQKGNPVPKTPFYAKFAISLACLCIGIGLLLPVLKSRSAGGHPMPAGQLQADLRTMVATARYLCQAESDFENSPAWFCASSPLLAQRTNSAPFGMPGGSNQTAVFNSSSNRPA